MALYNFTLTLSGVTARTVGLEDALHAAGCADALVCFYGTAVYLEFDRERDSLEQAILSAIADIESASTLNARVESVDSALVGLSDIARTYRPDATGRRLIKRWRTRLRSVSRAGTAG
ncbi:DNA-binding protein [Klebsiella michiganensis]|nr:DNA-binding protein [Klebsiella michiganensis]